MLEAVQEFEGYIIEVRSNSFVAMLLDITNNKKVEDEEVELPKDLAAEQEQPDIKIGSFFRLAVGYEKDYLGEIKKCMEITFIRAS